jgi:propionyl-CoA carboxylase beta chain
VFVFSQDFTVFGGSLSETHAEKICKVMDHAMKVGAPVIGLNDSGGARIQEGVDFARRLRRRVPAQRAGLGRGAADLADHGALRRRRGVQPGDDRLHLHGQGLVVHVRHRPEVVKTVTHEEVTAEELGGAVTHNTKSGVADLAFENDVEALMMTRRLVGFLPSSNREKPPRSPCADSADRLDLSLDTLVPDNPNSRTT